MKQVKVVAAVAGLAVILFACAYAIARYGSTAAKNAAVNAEVAKRVEANKANRPAPPPAEKRAVLFTPRREIACATDPNFLDSAPMNSPANFVRISPGTKLAKVGGSSFSTKHYWILSAGGRDKIYVYANSFDDLFEKVE